MVAAIQLVLALLFSGALFHVVEGISWNPQRSLRRFHLGAEQKQNTLEQAKYDATQARLPNAYSIALQELQELESQPLCHRIAARLLVNNCHLLEGQDETAVLTDSGRITRDFIDAYAASLAICDLERGNFAIPRTCAKFCEPVLTNIPIPTSPSLHVSTAEIDRCLEGLAQADSAWNTWISYRHKAVRFCEAARADYEKDETIRLYQKVTEIMSKLTENVELKLDEKLRNVDEMLQRATSQTEAFLPHIEQLKSGILNLESTFTEQVAEAVKKSSLDISSGLKDASQLRDILHELMEKMQQRQTEVIDVQENALQAAASRASSQLDHVLAVINAASVTTYSLEAQLKETEIHTASVLKRQETLEQGMNRLQDIAETLWLRQEHQVTDFSIAEESMRGVLGSIKSLETSTERIKGNLLTGASWSGWWPYIVCPVMSLVIGSYRLAPSALRNLLLLGLGEITGAAVAAFQKFEPSFHTQFFTNIFRSTFSQNENMTSIISS